MRTCYNSKLIYCAHARARYTERLKMFQNGTTSLRKGCLQGVQGSNTSFEFTVSVLTCNGGRARSKPLRFFTTIERRGCNDVDEAGESCSCCCCCCCCCCDLLIESALTRTQFVCLRQLFSAFKVYPASPKTF